MPRFVKIIAAVFALIGLGLLWGGAESVLDARQLLKHGLRTQGTVTELLREESRETTTDANGSRSMEVRVLFYPKVGFESADGRAHQFKSRMGSSSPGYSVGDTVPVIYLASAPQEARIEGKGTLWGAAIGMLLFGALFFAIGGGLLGWGFSTAAMQKDVMRNGRRLELPVSDVELDTSVTVGGRHPWRVQSQWRDPATGKLHLFKSGALWVDPSHLAGGKVGVFVDIADPRRYCMDPASLPSR